MNRSVADLTILTLSLFGGLASYLANPCGPAQWSVVKAARPVHNSMPTSSRGAARASEPLLERTFDDVLAGMLA